jgi:hypothetical protein
MMVRGDNRNADIVLSVRYRHRNNAAGTARAGSFEGTQDAIWVSVPRISGNVILCIDGKAKQQEHSPARARRTLLDVDAVVIETAASRNVLGAIKNGTLASRASIHIVFRNADKVGLRDEPLLS